MHKNQKKLYRILASGHVILLWAGTPCTTFSIARKFDGLGPPPGTTFQSACREPGFRDRVAKYRGNDPQRLRRVCVAFDIRDAKYFMKVSALTRPAVARSCK